jgi:hypothetical protein
MSDRLRSHDSSTETEHRASSTTSDPIRRSVEVEYWVVDEQGRLTDPDGLVEGVPGVEREFVVPLVEVKTTPCVSTDDLREELSERLGRVLRRAETQGKRLVPLATPVYDGHVEDLPSERTRIQDRIVDDSFEYVRHCAGTHVHVEQQPGRAVDQLNALTAVDPALALVNSSPYFGYEWLATGARSKLYRWLAYETLPHQGRLWPYVEDRAEWARRLENRYQEFVTEAVIAGCDRDAVESNFQPESAVWTPVKFRAEFSTVEWRSPDTALPSQVIRLADDVVGFVEHALEADVEIGDGPCRVSDDRVVLPPFDTVRDRVETAIHEGLSAPGVRDYLEDLGFDTSAYDPVSREIGDRGSLSVSAARELRLEYAQRLEQDLHRTQSIRPG